MRTKQLCADGPTKSIRTGTKPKAQVSTVSDVANEKKLDSSVKIFGVEDV